ncbi:MAG: putative Dynein intermediate chain 2, ciliary [Streblomastix strix]|uniref:Putative Dynein intermediate chain 2, ciliary n=1 Tax=Streblomastix strix TaxID=222440 RepID=A0A5J4WID1_9EUKA|nr:MAG: putative Dynein intermediate chain 2, ciliary [Streblomastix strix]
MNEEMQLMLNSSDSFISTNITRYSFKDKNYKLETNTPQTRIHFDMNSKSVPRDSVAEQPGEGEAAAVPDKVVLRNAFNISSVGTQTINHPPKDKEVNTEPIEFQEFSATVTQWEIFDEYIQDQAKLKAEKDQKKRPGLMKKGAGGAGAPGAETGGPLIAIPQVTPMPPQALSESGGGIVQDESFISSTSEVGVTAKTVAFESDPEVLKKLQVLERMTLQNTFEGISGDFKFWEDPSDPTKGDLGSLLPLWTFAPASREARKKSATCVSWHPKYPDFFAVGYGSFEFNKAGGGALAVYTLKNHIHPEYSFTFDSGVMSVSWNKKHPPYVCIGLANGVVASFDIRNFEGTLSQSKIDFIRRKGDVKGKHTDIVWSVSWEDDSAPLIPVEEDHIMYQRPSRDKKEVDKEEEEIEKKKKAAKEAAAKASGDGEGGGKKEEKDAKKPEEEDKGLEENRANGVGLVLSVGCDGRVTRWRREKERMIPTDIIILKSESKTEQETRTNEGPDEREDTKNQSTKSNTAFSTTQATQEETSDETAIVFQQAVAGCTSLDIHPTRTHLILVGTEEGYVRKCTKAYSGEILSEYLTNKKNNQPIYAAKWNPIHPRVFLTAGADWNVYLWDHTLLEPQLVFPLGSSIGDVCWAPFSSTIFAACTSEGKVFVFDLNINRQEPLCEQLIVKNTKLTRLSFSLFDLVLAVADDKGNVHSFKLSPNLRRPFKNTNPEQEIERMESVLDYADRCKQAGM